MTKTFRQLASCPGPRTPPRRSFTRIRPRHSANWRDFPNHQVSPPTGEGGPRSGALAVSGSESTIAGRLPSAMPCCSPTPAANWPPRAAPTPARAHGPSSAPHPAPPRHPGRPTAAPPGLPKQAPRRTPSAPLDSPKPTALTIPKRTGVPAYRPTRVIRRRRGLPSPGAGTVVLLLRITTEQLRRHVDVHFPTYPPTTGGAELCVHPLHCSKTAEGERFLVGWSVYAHFSHS